MTTILLDRPFDKEQLTKGDSLDLRNLDKKIWPQILEKCNAAKIHFYHIKLDSLDGIEKLHTTTSLILEWATKISGLTPVFKMNQLTHLDIIDFPKISNIAGISSLINIEQLTLCGSRGSGKPLNLESLDELVCLPNLSDLSIFNTKLESDDISILAECNKLKRLSLSNQFPKKQYAYLAKKLNYQLETPIVSAKETHIRCNKCEFNKYMFTGKRMPFLCRYCDNDKYEKLTEDFQKMVAKA